MTIPSILTTKAAIIGLSATVVVGGTTAAIVAVNHYNNKKAPVESEAIVSDNAIDENVDTTIEVEPTKTKTPVEVEETKDTTIEETDVDEDEDVTTETEDDVDVDTKDTTDAKVEPKADTTTTTTKTEPTKTEVANTPVATPTPAPTTPEPTPAASNPAPQPAPTTPAPAAWNCATQGHKWEKIPTIIHCGTRQVPNGTYSYSCPICGCTNGGHNPYYNYDSSTGVQTEAPCPGTVQQIENCDTVPYEEQEYETRCSICGATQ